ncbi:MAG: DUF2889 domain-containing protein [Telluria sp.]|nr:DUF2889 domain-containing protein [Telluria sp.]
MNPGIYRRSIRITTSGNGARAELEDDLHRFSVMLRHDGERVSAIEAVPVRYPWSLCGQADMLLERLVGMPLSPDALAVFRHTEGSEQCTHMFDLAGLAIAHAARGTPVRSYDIAAPYFQEEGVRTLSLRRDGHDILHWTVNDTTLLAPPAFAGRDIRSLSLWARGAFSDPDDVEAVVLLRRAVLISKARLQHWDRFATAADTGHATGACYVFQPGVQERALRMVGASREFTDAPGQLLSGLDSSGAM